MWASLNAHTPKQMKNVIKTKKIVSQYNLNIPLVCRVNR